MIKQVQVQKPIHSRYIFGVSPLFYWSSPVNSSINS